MEKMDATQMVEQLLETNVSDFDDPTDIANWVGHAMHLVFATASLSGVHRKRMVVMVIREIIARKVSDDTQKALLSAMVPVTVEAMYTAYAHRYGAFSAATEVVASVTDAPKHCCVLI